MKLASLKNNFFRVLLDNEEAFRPSGTVCCNAELINGVSVTNVMAVIFYLASSGKMA